MSNQEDQNADLVIERVLARFNQKPAVPRAGMARATLVLDAGVAFLSTALQEANFHVIVPRDGMEDIETKKALLAHRILITKNTPDFLDDAPVLDYGIIGLEALPSVDSAPDYKANQTAQLISEAILDFELTRERTGYVLMLRADGHHVFRHLD